MESVVTGTEDAQVWEHLAFLTLVSLSPASRTVPLMSPMAAAAAAVRSSLKISTDQSLRAARLTCLPGCAGTIQMCYCVCALWASIGNATRPPMVPGDISVVAIGRNEGKRLIECLASVQAVTDNIVYVDSGSTDGSAEQRHRSALLSSNWMGHNLLLQRGKKRRLRRLKARKPNVRYVQFVDGDCTLAEGWLDKAIAFLDQQKAVAIVCGRRQERYPTASIYSQLFDFEWNTPVGEASACGGDALVRVEASRPWVDFAGRYLRRRARALRSAAGDWMEDLAPRCGNVPT